MAANPKLIKDWIQYLKNNQIVDTKSDPNTGKLKYRREVTANDLHEFLELNTDYTADQISNAIHMVLSKKAIGQQPPKLQNKPTPGSDLSTWHHSEMRPGAFPPKKMPSNTKALPNEQPSTDTKQTPQLGYARTPGAQDIDFKDVEDKPEEKPKKKSWFRRGVNEDFEDEQGYALDEQDVEAVFGILAGIEQGSSEEPVGTDQAVRAKAAPVQQGQAGQVPKTPAESARDLNKFKRLIRNHMSDGQRKALWRALNDV